MSYAIVAGSMFVGPFESEEDATNHLLDARNAYEGVSTTVVNLVDPDERLEIADNAVAADNDESDE